MKLPFHPEEPAPHLHCYEILLAEGASGTNDSAVILSISVGGLGDGMDTRLMNSHSPPLEERNSGQNIALFTRREKYLWTRSDLANGNEGETLS